MKGKVYRFIVPVRCEVSVEILALTETAADEKVEEMIEKGEIRLVPINEYIDEHENEPSDTYLDLEWTLEEYLEANPISSLDGISKEFIEDVK